MTPQQIKDAAPEGATHYSETPMEYIYLRTYNTLWQCYAFGEWWHYDVINGEEIKPL